MDHRPRIAPDQLPLPSRLAFRAWPLWARITAIVVGLLATGVVPMVATIMISLLAIPPGPVAGLFEKAFMLLVMMGLCLWLCRPRTGQHVGVGAVAWPRLLAWSAAGFVLLNVTSVVWNQLTGAKTSLSDMGFGKSVTSDLVVIVTLVVVAPVAEEFLFRGLIHRGLRDTFLAKLGPSLSVGLATAASSLAFMSIHLGPDQVKMLPVYVLYGVVTALAYEFTGSLYAPVLIHCATNAFALISGSLRVSVLTEPWLLVVIALAPIVGLMLTWVAGRALDAITAGRNTAIGAA